MPHSSRISDGAKEFLISYTFPTGISTLIETVEEIEFDYKRTPVYIKIDSVYHTHSFGSSHLEVIVSHPVSSLYDLGEIGQNHVTTVALVKKKDRLAIEERVKSILSFRGYDPKLAIHFDVPHTYH